MSAEAVNSLSHRLLSLEDIIRQQEQTIGAVLQRLREVEQYAAAESRSREQAQQQLYAALNERGGTSAEATNRLQAQLQNQGERLGALQAEQQAQGAALRSVNDKHDAALHGMEQRLQADVGGVHQRAQTGEAASAEAMRSVQAQLQSLASATQAVESRSRDDMLALQQQMSAELATQRQRSDNLENAIRDALRDVHGSLSGDVRTAGAQQRGDLDGAVQRINQALEALDQRTRIDMNQLHTTEQADTVELRRRMEEMERNVRDVVQAATNGLAAEVAQVAQHSQALDRRQATAHQGILQELAKHDSQLETVDLNWRASVTDLSAKVRDDVAAAQQRAAAGDQALHTQLVAAQERQAAATEALRRDVGELSRAMQETCVRPAQEAQRTVAAQELRLSRFAEEHAVMQDYLKTFAKHVDEDAAKFRQVVEAAVRTAHSDLLERISHTSAALTMQQDPALVREEVHRGLTKLWDDAKSVFLTQRNLNDVQTELATLESAVRLELCTLADRHNEVLRSIDELRVAQARAAAAAAAARQSGTSPAAPLVAAQPSPSALPRRSAESSSGISAMVSPVTGFAAEPSSNTRATTKAAHGVARKEEPAVLGRAASGRSLQSSQSLSRVVEEIDRDSDDHSERLQQQEDDIKLLRSSLQRLRIAQAQEYSRAAPTPPSAAPAPFAASHPLDASAVTAAAAQADDASREARAAAREAAQSAKAAETAQNDGLRTANELRLALSRVTALEESLHRKMADFRAAHTSASRAPTAQLPKPLSTQQSPVRPAPLSKVSTSSTSPTTSPAPAATFAKLFSEEEEQARSARRPRPSEEVQREEREDNGKVHVSDAAASLMSYSPLKPTPSSGAAGHTPSDLLVKVPGTTTGEVFLVRQESGDDEGGRSASQASVQGRPASSSPSSVSAKMVLSPTRLAVKAAGTPTDAMPSVATNSRNGGSPLSEVLLPTHQFVRKREYTNFKDFTKQEIDAVWVELLSMRRTKGLSKEEVLLHISQSKEQMLSTVLRIVQQQERETLSMLAGIKSQLSDINDKPSAGRRISVFSMDNGQQLEELVRNLAGEGQQKQSVNVDSSTPPAAANATAPARTASAAAPTVSAERSLHASSKVQQLPTWPATQSAAGSTSTPTPTPVTVTAQPPSFTLDSVPPKAPSAAAAVRVPVASAPACGGEDTAVSSGRSTEPLQPQFIPPVVQRYASQPSQWPDPREVSFSSRDARHPLQLPPRQPPQSASRHESPVGGASMTPATSTHASSARPQSRPHSRRQYATAALVHPLATAPAPHPADPGGGPIVGPSALALMPPTTANLELAGAARFPAPHLYRSPPRQRLLPASAGEAMLPGGGGGARAGDDPKRYLKESKSPRNPAGGSFHLNPLHGLGPNTSPPRVEPGVRRAATAAAGSSPPAPAAAGLAQRPVQTAVTRPSGGVGAERSKSQSPPLPRPSETDPDGHESAPHTDTSPERYQPATISQESEIYFESVAQMRPSPRARRASADAARQAQARRSESPRRNRDPGHLYERNTPIVSNPSVRVLEANPREQGAPQSRMPYPRREQQQQRQSGLPPPQLPPATPQPQQRDHTPARDRGSDAGRRDPTTPHGSSGVQVLPSSAAIHLGPYVSPTPAESLGNHGHRGSTAGTGARAPLGSGTHPFLEPGRRSRDNSERDVHSRAPAPSQSPDRPRPSTKTQSDVVPVRVLEGPANRQGISSKPSSAAPTAVPSSAAIRVHPYSNA